MQSFVCTDENKADVKINVDCAWSAVIISKVQIYYLYMYIATNLQLLTVIILVFICGPRTIKIISTS